MRFAVLLLLALAVLGRSALAADGPEAGFRYSVRIEGLGQTGDLATLVQQSSALVSKVGDPPPSRAGLQRRADGDLDRFETAARSLGYYDAKFRAEIQPGAAGDDPPVVVVSSEPGVVYTVGTVEIRAIDDAAPALGIDLPRKRIGLVPGTPAHAADVVSAEATVLRLLQEQGHPLATIGRRTVLIDRDAKTMQVTLRVDPGPSARFGPVKVVGAETVDPTFVLRRLPWRFGETADIRKVEAGRRALTATGVFETAGIQFDKAVGSEGLIPVTVTVTERPPRSIGAGLSASTSEGLGATAFWSHRNLFGGAERLDLTGRYGEVESSATAELRLPDVFATDQDLIFNGGLIEENTDSYDSFKTTAGARFERRLSEILTVDYGVSLERSKIKEDDTENLYTLVGFPLGAKIDTSNDLLNPTRGGRTRIRFTPYLESLGSTVGFYSVSARHSQYVSLDSEGRVVLAGRAAIGSTIGASTTNVPADKRFYAGGSGSVRGYALQKIGPLDSANDPVGGRSVLEFGAELRWRVYGDFGIVPFIDAGQVYDDEAPDLSQKLQWAAGLGFRYFTPIGPVRADIAFPLNPRSTDEAFQVYFSLGQAF